MFPAESWKLFLVGGGSSSGGAGELAAQRCFEVRCVFFVAVVEEPPGGDSETSSRPLPPPARRSAVSPIDFKVWGHLCFEVRTGRSHKGVKHAALLILC